MLTLLHQFFIDLVTIGEIEISGNLSNIASNIVPLLRWAMSGDGKGRNALNASLLHSFHELQFVMNCSLAYTST